MSFEKPSVKEIERLASKGESMPKNLRLPEAMLYMALRSLYTQFTLHAINKQQGAEDKANILLAYYDLATKCDLVENQCADIKYRLSEAALKYLEEPTVGNAFQLLNQFYTSPIEITKSGAEQTAATITTTTTTTTGGQKTDVQEQPQTEQTSQPAQQIEQIELSD